MSMVRLILVWSVVTVTVVACGSQPQVNQSSMSGLIAGENDCRRLWQHTYWVERQLDPGGARNAASLRAAVDEVSVRYDVPIPAFSHCWEVLKVAGYQPPQAG